MAKVIDSKLEVVGGKYRIRKQIGAGSFGAILICFAGAFSNVTTQALFSQDTTLVLEKRSQSSSNLVLLGIFTSKTSARHISLLGIATWASPT
jgi:hypothetical protein